jgi:hypothetical protein
MTILLSRVTGTFEGKAVAFNIEHDNHDITQAAAAAYMHLTGKALSKRRNDWATFSIKKEHGGGYGLDLWSGSNATGKADQGKLRIEVYGRRDENPQPEAAAPVAAEAVALEADQVRSVSELGLITAIEPDSVYTIEDRQGAHFRVNGVWILESMFTAEGANAAYDHGPEPTAETLFNCCTNGAAPNWADFKSLALGAVRDDNAPDYRAAAMAEGWTYETARMTGTPSFNHPTHGRMILTTWQEICEAYEIDIPEEDGTNVTECGFPDAEFFTVYGVQHNGESMAITDIARPDHVLPVVYELMSRSNLPCDFSRRFAETSIKES